MVELIGVNKQFGEFVAVDDVNLQVGSGEFLTLLGPSGCGKTTLLRMISGFETPTRGTVWLDGRDVTALPPYRRDVNQVFQSYALFPHLNVRDNIAFGLRMKRTPKADVQQRVARMVEMVGLSGMENRRPNQLSGGQRQRVALARALVCEPKVLLLDEPLAALDAKLRRAMQVELKRLQQRVGITFVFVTHDQDEALVMSDRIAVINRGHIEQIGPVSEIYHRPATRFVADFLGQANLLPARVVQRETFETELMVADEIRERIPSSRLPDGASTAFLAFRPEKVRLVPDVAKPDDRSACEPNSFITTIAEELFRGATDQLLLRTPKGTELTAVVPNGSATVLAMHRGDRVLCHLHPDDLIVLNAGQ